MKGDNKAESVAVYCNQQTRRIVGIWFWLLGCFLISLATIFTFDLAYLRTNLSTVSQSVSQSAYALTVSTCTWHA
jgi:hypothetical protein